MSPLPELIRLIADKTATPSAWRSADWERLPVELRRRAFFSAGVTHGGYLGEFQKRLVEMIGLARESGPGGDYWAQDRSRIIAEMRRLGEDLGIAHPDGPRPGGKIREGDLTDPLSTARLRLIVETQMEMAHGQADYLAGTDPAILRVWPCWELVRISPRKRVRNWRQRWQEAGGQFYGGRMIAHKLDGIWTAISRFGTPHPPFDYRSGMGVEEVLRSECQRLGVPLEVAAPAAQTAAEPPPLQASVESLSPELQDRVAAAIEEEAGGVERSVGDSGAAVLSLLGLAALIGAGANLWQIVVRDAKGKEVWKQEAPGSETAARELGAAWLKESGIKDGTVEVVAR